MQVDSVAYRPQDETASLKIVVIGQGCSPPSAT
jgi:hypothetical protein